MPIGNACMFALLAGPYDDGLATNSANIDSAYVFETSGDAFVVRFQAPTPQTSDTLSVYLYCSAVTGTPDFSMDVRNAASSGDAQRPAAGGSVISSSPNTVTLGAGDVNTWVGPFTCTVSLTRDAGYFCIIKNTSADPVNNHAAFRYRAALDSFNFMASTPLLQMFGAGFTTDGMTSDPTMSFASGSGGAAVAKFADGTLIGNPYVSDDSAHANNQNDRGNQFTFTEDVEVVGVFGGSSVSQMSHLEINKSSDGTNVVQIATTYFSETGGSAAGWCAPVTIPGGVAHDYVSVFGSNSTIGSAYTMGEALANVPADVLACRPFSCAYVDGATPGPYTTVDPSRIMFYTSPIIADFPAIADVGSGSRFNRGFN